ncbi:MAG: hypothetical protein LKJ17_08260 [Oscillospiraceae bacterium]|jgi:hypothetical protein|nr:hypothetical protein [Oscillospiraceae bacterium]
MTKKDARLLALACMFIGIVVGFLLAPIKAGISCCNHNTITTLEGKEQKNNLAKHPAKREDHSEEPC